MSGQGSRALAAEQAALRRVATLVARGTRPEGVFAAITEEVGRLLPVDFADMSRCESDGTVTFVAAWGSTAAVFPVGSRWLPEGNNLCSLVARTGRPARIESYADASGPIDVAVRDRGIRSAVGAPIIVEGRMWGVMAAGSSREEPMPPDTEARLTQFTELLATSVANAESRAGLARLAEEQAALRRVATLVAQAVPPNELFRAATAEAGTLLGADFAWMGRHETDHTPTVLATWAASGRRPDVEARWPLEEGDRATRAWRTGRPARMDGNEGYPAPRAAVREKLGIRSSVACPILVEGRAWGELSVHSTHTEPLPADTESRLTQFTELVATAMSNAQARSEVQRLADEQAALRRVATLIAGAAPAQELFNAVSGEVGTLFGADLAGMSRYENDATMTILAPWSAAGGSLDVPARVSLDGATLPRIIRDTGRPAREDAWDEVAGEVAELARDQLGVRSAVGSPIVVEGRVWGGLFVSSTHSAHLPGDTESRLENFAELVATAIANAQARAEVQRLVDEQAALRRVATLVAREASQAKVFTAIAEEIGQLLGTEEIRMLRYEEDRRARVVAGWGHAADVFPVDSRVRLGGQTAVARVFRTGRPVRIDDYASVSGALADSVRSIGIRSVAATPIHVEGRLWGAMLTGTAQAEALPPETVHRLGQFTELMATAIGNTESHARAERLAEEQAALRRVATLVAKESAPADVFAKVAEEVANAIGDVDCALCRVEADGTVTTLAAWGAGMLATVRVGEPFPVDGDNVVARVLLEGRPCRIDGYLGATGTIPERGREHGIQSAAGCPIVVRGRTWGVAVVAKYDAEPLPPEAESRVTKFTDLVATAIANAEARTEVERLAEEQAALRRVATLVAEGAPPTAVLNAVAAEMEALLDADQVALNRYEPGAEISVLAHRGLDAARTPVGSRVSLEGVSVTATVQRTGRPARMESFERAPGPLAELARATGERSSVGVPIVVDGRLWGIITASWKGEESPPADTEARMARFAQLLDAAIANADSRDQLTASRARLLTAADEARRRVVRDLHDGAQQRLVHTVVALKLARQALRERHEQAASLVDEALEQVERGNAELRELAHGILPAALTRGGLRAGVDTMVARLDLPVHLDAPADRFPAEIEASAYFIVAEAITNVVKHAQARSAEVSVSAREGTLHVAVRDDGIGGADPHGHGLVGMGDRAAALGGRLEIDSPIGGGTLVAATLPL